VEFWKSDKCARILRSSGFWHIFRICKIQFVSTSKGYEKFRCFCRRGAQTDPHSYGRKKPRHFTWPVRVLISGISLFWKKCQNPAIPRILTLYSDLWNSTFKYPQRPWEVPNFLPHRHSHRYPQSFRPKKFTCHFRVLKSGILQFRKKYQNPETLTILALFWIFKILLLSTLTGHVKCEVPQCVSNQA
jgi:hypothetical protein